MGIDCYLHWKGQTEAEKRGQVTGFSVTSGHAGYLREGYHGGPYATKVLIPEGWKSDDDDGVAIPAATLRARLPATVLCATYRNHVVYGQGTNPGVGQIEDGNVLTVIAPLLAESRKGVQQDELPTPSAEQVRAVSVLIEKRHLPGYALAFVDFVLLAESKERETGEPCRVYVSY